MLIQTVSFLAKNMQQKESNINKAKCQQCLQTYRHHPFVCTEMTSEPFGKYMLFTDQPFYPVTQTSLDHWHSQLIKKRKQAI